MQEKAFPWPHCSYLAAETRRGSTGSMGSSDQNLGPLHTFPSVLPRGILASLHSAVSMRWRESTKVAGPCFSRCSRAFRINAIQSGLRTVGRFSGALRKARSRYQSSPRRRIIRRPDFAISSATHGTLFARCSKMRWICGGRRTPAGSIPHKQPTAGIPWKRAICHGLDHKRQDAAGQSDAKAGATHDLIEKDPPCHQVVVHHVNGLRPALGLEGRRARGTCRRLHRRQGHGVRPARCHEGRGAEGAGGLPFDAFQKSWRANPKLAD